MVHLEVLGMDARTLTKQVLAGLAVAALLAGCSAGATVAPSSATPAPATTASPAASAAAAPSASPTAQWSVVSISDSVFGSGDDGDVAAINIYAHLMEKDLGVTTAVHGHWYGGHTSDEVLDLIRNDAALRKDVASANVIVFEVPLGELRYDCPFDNENWHPTGTAAEWEACAPKVAAHNTANAKKIVDELVALRSPDDALFRAVNLWEIGYRDNVRRGIEPAMHTLFTSANAGLVAAAASHGIPVVDAWTAFMGPDGTIDPVATGDLLDDMSHLAGMGAIKLAGLLRGLGYTKAGATLSPAAEATLGPDASPAAAMTLAPAILEPASPLAPNASPMNLPPNELPTSSASQLGVTAVTPSALGRISWTVRLPPGISSSAVPLGTPHGPVLLEGENMAWRSSAGAWKVAPILGTARWPGTVLGDDLFLTDAGRLARFHWTGSEWVRAGSLEGLDTITAPMGLVAGRHAIVAYGVGGVAASTDGVTFTPAVDAPTCVASTVATGDRFVALRGPCQEGIGALSAGIEAGSLLQRFDEPIPWTSTDGLHWKPAATVSPFGSGSTITGVASRGGRQVAIGVAPPAGAGPGPSLAPAVWVSDDGLAWRRLPALPEAPCDSTTGGCSWATGFRTIVASDPGWLILAFDSSSMAWTSADGLDWEPLHGQPAIWGGYLPPVVALGSDLVVVSAIGQQSIAIGAILGP
jgi:hypothetical protein